MRTRTKGLVGVAIALLILLAVVLWPRAEATWELTLRADAETVVPWRSVTVDAMVAPVSVYGDGDGWTVRWSEDVNASGTRAQWKVGGLPGTKQLTVEVTSPAGTVKTATVEVEVSRPAVQRAGSFALDEPPADDEVVADVPFGFADVTVEKDVVCHGEESLITVTPWAETDEIRGHLTTGIGSESGWSVPFRSFGLEPKVHRVPIRTRDQSTDEEVFTEVYIEVQDCVAPFYVLVHKRQDPTSKRPEHIMFHAAILPGPEYYAYVTGHGRTNGDARPVLDPPPASYRWDFGDGTSVVTTEPKARHQYPFEEDRVGGATADYPVVVEALDAEDQVIARARTAVSFLNMKAHVKARAATVQLVVRYDRRPKEDEDGNRYVDVTLINWDPEETAILDALYATDLPCEDVESEPPRHRVALSDVFDTTVIGPQERVRGRVEISPAVFSPDGVCVRKLRAEGRTTPGDYKVAAVFRVNAHSSSSNERTPVAEDQTELLNKTAELLGGREPGTRITLEDVARLEREGKLPEGSHEGLKQSLATPAGPPR